MVMKRESPMLTTQQIAKQNIIPKRTEISCATVNSKTVFNFGTNQRKKMNEAITKLPKTV